LANRPSMYLSMRLWEITSTRRALSREERFLISYRARRLRWKHLSLFYKGTGNTFYKIFKYRCPKDSFLRMSVLCELSTCPSCHIYSSPLCSFTNLFIYEKSKLGNRWRLLSIGPLRSQILDSTYVSSGSTITCLTFRRLADIRIYAVSRALVSGETKIISTSLFFSK
jgi:hypothetical protein